jgi:hypothetical protein
LGRDRVGKVHSKVVAGVVVVQPDRDSPPHVISSFRPITKHASSDPLIHMLS